MAIHMAEALGRHTEWRVLATDLSTRKLAEARRARYSRHDLGPVPPEMAAKWFSPAGPDLVDVHPSLKDHVVFARLNLLERPFPMRGPFDAIFCRYVMMYFDTKVRTGLLEEFASLLPPGGLLYIGRGEVLEIRGGAFDVIRPSVLRRR